MAMSEWISVKDRLPSPVDSVLIVTRSGGVGEGFHEKGKWWWITEDEVYVEVTHWMPLPEPPREED